MGYLLFLIGFSLGAAVMNRLCRNDYSEGLKDGHNNAIDEFVEQITLPLTEEDISRIAEQLKGGVE